MREYLYSDCLVGMKESFEVTITEDMLVQFREITGDYNPLHNEIAFANEHGYKKCVSYGMLTASFLSTLAGMYLPGKYCLIQEVDVKFVKPVFAGDLCVVFGEVTDKNDLFKQITLKVRILNQNGDTVLRGKMKVGTLEETGK